MTRRPAPANVEPARSPQRAARVKRMPPRAANGTRWPSISRLADLASVVAVVVVPFYVLGVAVLMAHFFGYYGLSLGEAWYAVGLLPRTTIVGHALYAVALGALIGLISVVTHAGKFASAFRRRGHAKAPVAPTIVPPQAADAAHVAGDEEPSEAAFPRPISSTPDHHNPMLRRLTALGSKLGLAKLLALLHHPKIRGAKPYISSFSILWVGGILFFFGTDVRKWVLGTLLIAVIVIATGIANALLERPVASVGTVLAAIGLLYVPAYCIAVGQAWFEEPRLPDVWLVAPTTVAEEGETSGKLLAHADGYWHVFDDRERVVVAVADSQVVRATFGRPAGQARSTPVATP